MSEQNHYETTEEQVSSNDLLSRVKALIHEGNVRHIILKGPDGKKLLDLPVNAGLGVSAVSLALAPLLVAVGAVAALVSRVTVVVERDPEAR